MSQGDIFVLKREARSRYEIKVVKVHDHFIEVESLSRGLSMYRQGSFSLSELHRFKSGVLVLGKSLELVTQTMDAGAIWKLSLKKIIEG